MASPVRPLRLPLLSSLRSPEYRRRRLVRLADEARAAGDSEGAALYDAWAAQIPEAAGPEYPS